MVLRRLLLVPKIGQDLFAEETHGALHLLVGVLTHVDIQKQVADPCIPQLGHLLRHPFWSACQESMLNQLSGSRRLPRRSGGHAAGVVIDPRGQQMFPVSPQCVGRYLQGFFATISQIYGSLGQTSSATFSVCSCVGLVIAMQSDRPPLQ